MITNELSFIINECAQGSHEKMQGAYEDVLRQKLQNSKNFLRVCLIRIQGA